MTEGNFAPGGFIPGPSVLVSIDPRCEVIIRRDEAQRYGREFLARLTEEASDGDSRP